MATRTFRITVRGMFASLTPDQLTVLRAAAAEHDLLRSSYTREGDWSYELSATPVFRFQFLDEGEDESDIIDASARAELVVEERMKALGYGFKNLKTSAVDLSVAPLSKRQRQAQR